EIQGLQAPRGPGTGRLEVHDEMHSACTPPTHRLSSVRSTRAHSGDWLHVACPTWSSVLCIDRSHLAGASHRGPPSGEGRLICFTHESYDREEGDQEARPGVS